MKRIAVLLIMCFAFLFGTLAWAGDVYVKGYTKKDGTYVAPHYRSAPDGNPYNNWSTKGNVNPHTGQPGYKNPTPSTGYSNPSYKPANPYNQ